jgi:hypothetical protein
VPDLFVEFDAFLSVDCSEPLASEALVKAARAATPSTPHGGRDVQGLGVPRPEAISFRHEKKAQAFAPELILVVSDVKPSTLRIIQRLIESRRSFRLLSAADPGIICLENLPTSGLRHFRAGLPRWTFAHALLIEAQRRGKARDMKAAIRQFKQAVKNERWDV